MEPTLEVVTRAWWPGKLYRALGQTKFGTAPVVSKTLTAIGFMSGTSLDGIDAAVVRTDGHRVESLGPAHTYPYPETFRDQLRSLLGQRPHADAAPVIEELTHRHFDAFADLLASHGLDRSRIDAIGFHGQTVLHAPDRRETFQIGDGQKLADLTDVRVVCDFRSADVRAGGEGAPLVPLYQRALARDLPKPVAILNIGGVANVTWLGGSGETDERSILAFDTGPGNALIDDWVAARTGLPFDIDGRLSAAGEVRSDLVDRWLSHPYFRRRPPKSLDREAFASVKTDLAELSLEDGAATLTALTAGAIAKAMECFRERPLGVLVTGGGRHNPTLLDRIARMTTLSVDPVEVVGWRGDSLEAEAFAFLAVRSLRGLSLTLPTTTGVARPLTGGTVKHPRRSRTIV